jgi:hypothetical protein
MILGHILVRGIGVGGPCHGESGAGAGAQWGWRYKHLSRQPEDVTNASDNCEVIRLAADSRSANQGIPCLSGTGRFITTLTKACH